MRSRPHATSGGMGLADALDGISAADMRRLEPAAIGRSKPRFGSSDCTSGSRGGSSARATCRTASPTPDVFLHAAEAMGVAAVMRGGRSRDDRTFRAGVDAALAAGMRVFGDAGGIVPVERLAKATLGFTDMRRLPEMLAAPARRRLRIWDTEALLHPDAPPRLRRHRPERGCAAPVSTGAARCVRGASRQLIGSGSPRTGQRKSAAGSRVIVSWPASASDWSCDQLVTSVDESPEVQVTR